MLVKIIFLNNGRPKLKPVSGKANLSQLCLEFILVGSLLLSLPLSKQAISKSKVMSTTFYSSLHDCVTGLFAISSKPIMVEAIDLYALDSRLVAWGSWPLSVSSLWKLPKAWKDRQTIRDGFSFNLITRAWPVCRSVSLPPLPSKDWGARSPWFFIPRFGWGHGDLCSIFVGVSLLAQALIILGAIVWWASRPIGWSIWPYLAHLLGAWALCGAGLTWLPRPVINQDRRNSSLPYQGGSHG